MTPTSRRQVARALRAAANALSAGIVKHPPAMHAEILEWVHAVAAANMVEAIKTKIAETKKAKKEAAERYDKVREAIDDIKANPTTWSAYKAFDEAMWAFGARSRRPVRDFQKLTPERKKALEKTVWAEIEEAEDRLKGSLGIYDEWVNEFHQELNALHTYLRHGVGPVDDEETKSFPINTEGWDYGTKEYVERLNDRLVTITQGNIESYKEALKLIPADKRRRLEHHIAFAEEDLAALMKGERADWKNITVTLALEPIQSEAASWSSGRKNLRIVIPRMSPDQLKHLSKALRHELQHFSQAWLSFIAGWTAYQLTEGGEQAPPLGGLPTKRSQTPEFQQEMSPGRSKADDPKTKALLKKLRSEGVNTKLIDFHDLDDIEFYTELLDAIERFNDRLAHNPLDAKKKRLAIKLFVGEGVNNPEFYRKTSDVLKYPWGEPDKFFAKLSRTKRSARKLREARSEFVKAVL